MSIKNPPLFFLKENTGGKINSKSELTKSDLLKLRNKI